MKRQAKLFLVRHGETVDNVAQVYAGSRDSALTNHGYQQATRLGQHFKVLDLSFTHIFSSHLQRAVKTAGLIREAQSVPASEHGPARASPTVIELPVLMEKDFGAYEGKKFHELRADQSAPENSGDNKGVESRTSMSGRADKFLDEHLLPLFDGAASEPDLCIAIVSHGMLLSVLWKRLLLRLPPNSVTLAPELAAHARNSLEHLGGWSNTGFLELHMSMEHVTQPHPEPEPQPKPISSPSANDSDQSPKTETNSPQILNHDSAVRESEVAQTTDASISAPTGGQSSCKKFDSTWTTVILTVNGKDHLKGLKRTGGGVGSSRHDDSQKSIESFFKRRKLE
ncbi:unnamed protein product [Periconia digitata]|uniref:Phosphoglycerate mutase-like protein n=1 Tax=Periconia digitata TaxID=1303443 RepID=A0A9W4U4Z8_9PLEO|nr:unnamed protein product [Periconia digitata]